MTMVDVLGSMEMWGISIDSVSVIYVVIGIGLSVLNGGISTFLAVMLLAFSKSYVFRILFQVFFLTIVFGLFHGMVLLPGILSLAGPSPVQGGGGKRQNSWGEL